MTDFITHTIATAPEGSKPILQGARDAYKFVPNLLATMAESPAMLEGYTSLAGIFDKSDLSETERQIILMTNNRLNGCEYCMAAHTSLSKMAKIDNAVIDALRTNMPIADSRYEALRQFAIIINETRGWPRDADIQAVLAAGYTRQNILEVILGTALKVMSNYTNHIAETAVDDAFSANAWSATVAKAA